MPCDQHDYVEIACIYHFPLKLILKSGDELEGLALDTQRNERQQECIKMELKGSVELVLLDSIAQMKALIDNPHFQIICFQQDSGR